MYSQNSVFLIGFMASGKSTIAKCLAKELNISYFDTDKDVQNRHRKSISEIFRNKGEKTFREYEYQSLKNSPTRAIVSTGGGCVTYPNSLNFLKQQKWVFWLYLSYEDTKNRLSNIQHQTHRPLAYLPEKELQERYESRLALYEAASNYKIHVGTQSIEELTACITQKIKI